MINGTGLHQKLKGIETEKRIKEYIDENPNALMKDVCKAMSITHATLRKYIKRIEAKKAA